MQDTDYLVLQSLAKILIRKGVILHDEIRLEADNLERISPDAAHNLTSLILEAESMSASEFEADYRRRQMRERTAYLAKKAERDGGKKDER